MPRRRRLFSDKYDDVEAKVDEDLERRAFERDVSPLIPTPAQMIGSLMAQMLELAPRAGLYIEIVIRPIELHERAAKGDHHVG